MADCYSLVCSQRITVAVRLIQLIMVTGEELVFTWNTILLISFITHGSHLIARTLWTSSVAHDIEHVVEINLSEPPI